VLQQPARFHAAEICAEGKTGGFTKSILPAIGSVSRNFIGNARILPDDRVRNGFACFFLPNDGGLPLIRDSTAASSLKEFQQFSALPLQPEWSSKNFRRIVLYQPGFG